MAQSASARRILALFFLLCPVNIIGTWWRVAASPLLMYSNRICREARRASGRAGTLCQREPQVVRAVVAGARLGLRECRHQFTRRRWDCSVPRKYFGRILQQDVRETAFVNAITSAGVTFAVTKACSLGELPQCGCEDPRGSTETEWLPAHTCRRQHSRGCGGWWGPRSAGSRRVGMGWLRRRCGFRL
uniref:Protein Wnt n=1 Tax=Eptatretus burgeri TaxID=7764 RepID=A0A8C4R6S3_EPTBU